MRRWLKWVAASVLAAGWAPIAVLAAHVTASQVVGAYLVFPTLDRPMHLFGGAAIAYFFLCSLRVRESEPVVGSLTATAAGLLALAATGTTTVLWEFAEWTMDHFLGTRMQRGLEDTLLDMCLGLMGGLAVIIVATARSRLRQEGETPEPRSASL